MAYLEVNGERLLYVMEGEGPPVVLIHSLGASVHMWRGLIDEFRGDYTLIASDCRGHGSSSNRGGFTVSAVADDLGALTDMLGLGSFHLIGISMGGLIALTLYSRKPESVRSLVLADSYAYAGHEGLRRVAQTREALKSITMREFGERYASDTLLPSTPAEVRRELAEVIGRMSPEAYLQTVESILTEDVTPILSNVRVPTLVLVGEKDRRTPVAVSEHLARSIPGAELRVIPDAGHLANLDNPGAFNAAIRAFLEADEQSWGLRRKEESR
jgi:pimeloyl-ACP methyl ester carboxylesterase